MKDQKKDQIRIRAHIEELIAGQKRRFQELRGFL